jgi:hypothetical protein
MLGRGDSNNRFNLFDNMSAYPQNRVWFTFQHLDSFQTGVGIDPASPAITRGFAPRRDENLYRLGAELKPFGNSAFDSRFSVAFQTQYIASTNTSIPADAWGNPDILCKYALIDTQCCAVSALLGIQPQTSTSRFELHEKTTRFYPGMLFYDAVTCRLFVQGGFQFGISDRSAPNTFDWDLGAGYWLYADWSFFDSPVPGCYRPCIVGVIPQVEFLGKRVVANSLHNPFDIPADPTVSGGPAAPFREPHSVVDFTAGVRVLFGSGLSVTAGGSFPLTGGQARRAEFLTTLGFTF